MKMKRLLPGAIGILMVGGCFVLVEASSSASYDVPLDVIAGGAGTASSASYTIRDAIAQPSCIGYAESANYSVSCGYLALEGGFRFGGSDNSTGLDGTSVRTDLEHVPVHLAVVFKLYPQDRLTPWASFGGGAEFVQWSISTTDGAHSARVPQTTFSSSRMRGCLVHVTKSDEENASRKVCSS